jgi:hypothetical protein
LQARGDSHLLVGNGCTVPLTELLKAIGRAD